MNTLKTLPVSAIFAVLFASTFYNESQPLPKIGTSKLPIILPIPERIIQESYAEKKARLIREFCGEYEVPENLVLAMIEQESRHNHKAISHKGAIGYMQLMPKTAKELGVDPKDPFDNLKGGIMYIGKQLKRFDGNIELALAAYNAGPGNVRKFGGVPPFKETQKYVKNIVNNIKENV